MSCPAFVVLSFQLLSSVALCPLSALNACTSLPTCSENISMAQRTVCFLSLKYLHTSKFKSAYGTRKKLLKRSVTTPTTTLKAESQVTGIVVPSSPLSNSVPQWPKSSPIRQENCKTKYGDHRQNIELSLGSVPIVTCIAQLPNAWHCFGGALRLHRRLCRRLCRMVHVRRQQREAVSK
jgi:hypothetical protein